MAFQEAGGYCSKCGKDVLVRRAGTNHILHLILTIITGGLWAIIWILSAIKFGGWRCTQCGSKASKKMFG